MIRKLKKQLFNPQFSFPALYPIALIGFFVYAAHSHTSLFTWIACTQCLVALTLFFFQYHLSQEQSEITLNQQDYVERINLLKAEIERDEHAIVSLGKKIEDYKKLKDLTEKLIFCLSLEDTSETLSLETDRLFGGDAVTTILYLFHSKTGELGISSSQKKQMRVNLKSKQGDIFDEWVVKTLQPLLVEDTKNDFRFDLEKNKADDSRIMRSMISVPLLVGHKAFGILRVDSVHERYFTTEHLRLLTTIGDLGAVAIENAHLYEKIEELAIHDSLTGLYLRRYLLERLGEEISRHLRHKAELSILMIDLDKFKEYNDQYGHTAGDIVLKTISYILLDTFKEPGQLVCRYGGEEFTIFLPDCPKNKAIGLAEELREKIFAQEIVLRKQKTHVSVSIGVASFPKDAGVKEELLERADEALYKAKNQGRNRVCYSL